MKFPGIRTVAIGLLLGFLVVAMVAVLIPGKLAAKGPKARIGKLSSFAIPAPGVGDTVQATQIHSAATPIGFQAEYPTPLSTVVHFAAYGQVGPSSSAPSTSGSPGTIGVTQLFVGPGFNQPSSLAPNTNPAQQTATDLIQVTTAPRGLIGSDQMQQYINWVNSSSDQIQTPQAIGVITYGTTYSGGTKTASGIPTGVSGTSVQTSVAVIVSSDFVTTVKSSGVDPKAVSSFVQNLRIS